MLRLRRDLLDAMVAHCRLEHPLEACGLLAGRDGLAERHIPMRNAEASRTRYAMDPEQQLAVWRDMEERGEQPVVIYHSHTAVNAYLSKTDIRYATEDAHYLVVSTEHLRYGLLEYPIEVRVFRVVDGMAYSESIRIDGGDDVLGFGGPWLTLWCGTESDAQTSSGAESVEVTSILDGNK